MDHDYVIKVAELAKQGGCDEFHLVSSQSANKDGLFFYQKTKASFQIGNLSLVLNNNFHLRVKLRRISRG